MPATPVANYTVRVNLNATFNYAACQADGDDVRFLDNTDAPMSFWTEKWTNGGDSILWVKVPLAGTSSIKIAYGNATIASGSNGAATFPLFDDFSGATINASKWTAEGDTYSTVTVGSGYVQISSLCPNPIWGKTWSGLNDLTINHGAAAGAHMDNSVSRGNEQFETERGGTYTITKNSKNQTWILMDYSWINGSSAVYRENESVVATHSTNVPTVSVPATFGGRTVYSGPGSNYGALIRSKTTFAPGYAIRGGLWTQGDFRTAYPVLETIIRLDWVAVRKTSSIESIASIDGGVSLVYSAMEDFETYTTGDDMQGKSGPLGDWLVTSSGGSYCKVADEGGNHVMNAVDTGSSGGVSSKVNFDVNGAINGINIVTWRQKITTEVFNNILFEGSTMCVQVQFSSGSQVLYYAPSHSGLQSTGLTSGTGWETYEVMLYSTSQFMLHQFKDGTWSAWVGPFELRNHWSSTGAVCSAWDLDGSTMYSPEVRFDDVGVRWYTQESVDTTSPSIVASGYSGSTIEQGDVARLNWTLFDAHPTTYTLYKNGASIQSGSYSSGTKVSVQIDSSSIGQLNYTMIAHDSFGNVQRDERLIDVVNRTDGGIFLTVDVNVIDRNWTHGFILTLNMSHWTVLYLDVDVTIVPTALVLPVALPFGLVVALPVAFNLNIANESALRSGFIRVHYDQAAIANQVNEADIVALRWSAGMPTWAPSSAIIDHSLNCIDIPLSENGMYIIASTPKQNYNPIIIIVIIGITGGIVAVAGFSYSRKKAIKQKATGSSKATKSRAYASTPAIQGEVREEALAKRARLMQVRAPESNPGQPIQSISSTDLEEMFGQAKKKAGAVNEPDIDITARAESAQKMASEVSVERVVPRCVVHKGSISGLSYTCKHCGVQYCITCAMHLAQSGENCWNCNETIDTEGLVPASAQTVPVRPMEGQVTVFGTEVFAKISELGIEENLVDDVLELLKDIPAEKRLQYLEDMVKDAPESDEDGF